jgi:hypothetical protein
MVMMKVRTLENLHDPKKFYPRGYNMALDKNFIKIAIAMLVVVVVFRMLCQKKSYETFQGYNLDDPYEIAAQPITGVTHRPISTGSPMTTPSPLAASVDLLPKSPADQKAASWAEYAPKSLEGQNFLDASKYIGVDTQGSSLRNANYQLRADPPIPRKDVGPWANSTIDGDVLRKPLDC